MLRVMGFIKVGWMLRKQTLIRTQGGDFIGWCGIKGIHVFVSNTTATLAVTLAGCVTFLRKRVLIMWEQRRSSCRENRDLCRG